MIDDHSRVAYVGARDDETKQTATAVLRNAVAWFTARGIAVRRVISDNGACYKSYLWRDACAELGITAKKTLDPDIPAAAKAIPRSATDRRSLISVTSWA